MSKSEDAPFIVGLGGSTRPGSSTERAVRLSLDAAEALGATTQLFDGPFLCALPHYGAGTTVHTPEQHALIDAVSRCDGIIVGSPGYHGSISGLIKNALDTLEALSKTTPVYLDNRAFGCIVTAYGWQACGTTLVTLRTIAHALRAWPTPLGVTINAALPLFDEEGRCVDDSAAAQLKLVAAQTVEFARKSSALRRAA
ncbi:NADPH-dependent FMN reductase [Caulobacter sp. S45]|jgi:FMN reductase|uniref:NADPH-dependent FMN reductase n=1 Tax=Caulobacter sp. S45 TaxID=1641861 RepID=UPI00131C8C7B|nr:NAD(P)H-dependent oxidoreductase [Caulobacter sp. S45]